MTEQINWITRTLQEVATLGELDVPASMVSISEEASARDALAEMIAFLIDKNFEKLLWILYRIDVDEAKAKQLLSQHLPDEAPIVLADLIMSRQKQKELFRASFNSKVTDEEDEGLLL
jgi:hypothetical protein